MELSGRERQAASPDVVQEHQASVHAERRSDLEMVV